MGSKNGLPLQDFGILSRVVLEKYLNASRWTLVRVMSEGSASRQHPSRGFNKKCSMVSFLTQ
jgi:hypothetical protein